MFGVYLLGTAATLVLGPNMFLTRFGLPPTQEPWLRVVGLVVGVIGYYYVYAARRELTDFFPASVHGRVAAAVVFLGLVTTGAAPWQLLLFGAVDLLAALWTRRAIGLQRAG